MKDLIKLFQILKEKYFASCLITRKKGAKEFLHKINGADMPPQNNKKETLYRIMVNLGTVLKEL